MKQRLNDYKRTASKITRHEFHLKINVSIPQAKGLQPKLRPAIEPVSKRAPPISSTSYKILTTSLLMLYLSPLTCCLYTRTFPPPRALLDERTDKSFPTETLCDLMPMILTMNNFVFNDEHFIQQHGTAMGTRMAPAFANLFMGELERKALGDYVDKPFLCMA